MEINLTKSEKKLARELFDIGLQREFKEAIANVENILKEHKNNLKDNRDTYHGILSYMKNHYRHLQKRYDSLSGSDYIFILAWLLKDNVISKEEIAGFRSEVKEILDKINDRKF
jgi:hypothetical protein